MFKEIRKRVGNLLRGPSTPEVIREVIREELNLDNLSLFASSDPRGVNKIISQMNETLKRRQDRGNTPISAPKIQMSEVDNEGKANFEVEYNDHKYHLRGRGIGQPNEFREWLEGYISKAPSCITCDQVIFPGEPVGECNKGIMHMSMNCCPSGGFFVGHIDSNGQVKPYFPETTS